MIDEGSRDDGDSQEEGEQERGKRKNQEQRQRGSNGQRYHVVSSLQSLASTDSRYN